MMRKEVWIGWFSSLIEAYNMAIYSFLVPILIPHFGKPRSLLLSYSLVFIGSFFYPIGAAYYGFIGDKRGRRKTCIHTTLGLGIATGTMSLFPLQENATWLFLACICAQHFFSGGEYHGSIVFSLEHSEDRKSGAMSGLSCLFAVIGLIFANGCAHLALLDQTTLWIRICFLIGAVGGLISYLLKKYCQETPAFIALSPQLLEETWFEMIIKNFNMILRTTIVLAFFIASYSFIFIFLPLHFTSSADTLISLIAYGVLLTISGNIADHIGIEKTLTLGSFLFCLSIPICFLSKNLIVIQLILTSCVCLLIGPIHAWMLTQFKVQHRCRGIFISSGIATSIFGGSTIPICLTIYEKFHSIGICSFYPLLLALGSLLCLRQKKDKEAWL